MTDSRDYWIGLTRHFPVSHRAALGWMSGEPLAYSNLGDLTFGSGCLQIQEADEYNKWNAAGCSTRPGYICERRGKLLRISRNFTIRISTHSIH